jgi:N-methylhydantoinase B
VGAADPVTTQVVRYAMEQIADEMGYTMVRTARSTIIKEIMDITCAVSDAQGRTIAQAHHAPMLLTGFEITMRELVQRFPRGTVEPGDVIAANDPYLGGQHVMDLHAFTPVFNAGEVVGWVASIAHHADMGGAAAGGVAGGLTEVYQEGIRFPMVKLYRAGAENADVFGIFAANIRVPEKTLGDVRAQAAANFLGARRLGELFEKYGAGTVHACAAALLDQSEGRIRHALRAIPDGDYEGEDFTDDDGVTDRPIRVHLVIRKRGDAATVDFAGTDSQVRGNTNCPIATVHAAVYYALICALDPHVPPNSGCYRPFTVLAPFGTVVNPRPPAAVGARTNTSQKVCEAMFRALAQALPDRVTAGSHGQITNCAFSGFLPDAPAGPGGAATGGQARRRFIYNDIQGGGAGARPTKDGRDGQDSHLARFMNTPVEAAELENPVRIERYELLPDTGGAGHTRGALGLRRDIRVLVEETGFARYGDRQKFEPWGLHGGLPGAKGAFRLNPDTPSEGPLRSKGFDVLHAGDVVSLRLPGAGGMGDPTTRDPALVEADVLDGKVSPESARDHYGVVVDPATLRLDVAATKALRATRR